MPNCFFASDLHGREGRYEKLFSAVINEKPNAVFLGGDLLPHPYLNNNFIHNYLVPQFNAIKSNLVRDYPRVFLILGNDDARSEESKIIDASKNGIWEYIHFRKSNLADYNIFGYCFTPPSPFLLKDWEKYDVSSYTEPGCISPEEGKRTVRIGEEEKKFSTIKNDLEILSKGHKFQNTIMLFHAPPYQTNLDRSALDGKMIDHVPLDVHVGSIAIKKFIEEKQPLITLHGHIHESASITGNWKDKIGETHCYSAAHNGKELALVKFNPEKPNQAERILI